MDKKKFSIVTGIVAVIALLFMAIFKKLRALKNKNIKKLILSKKGSIEKKECIVNINLLDLP